MTDDTQAKRLAEVEALAEKFKRSTNEMAQRLENDGVGSQEILAIVLSALGEFAGKLLYGMSLAANPRDEFVRESVRLLAGHADTVIGDLMAAEKARRQ